jgi:hypothetical protein
MWNATYLGRQWYKASAIRRSVLLATFCVASTATIQLVFFNAKRVVHQTHRHLREFSEHSQKLNNGEMFRVRASDAGQRASPSTQWEV